MSLVQRFLTAVLPDRWAGDMQAESRRWFLTCRCGWRKSVWDLGGVRWKAAGRPRKYGKCPACGRRSWMRLEKLDS